MMAEGVDVSALERMFEIKEETLRTWLTRAGQQADKVHRHFFHHLILHSIQLDEFWANVRQGSQEMWVWAAIDASSKLVPVMKMITVHHGTGLWGLFMIYVRFCSLAVFQFSAVMS